MLTDLLAIQQVPILLASASPRRKEILLSAGFSPRVISVDVEEVWPAEMPVSEVAVYLAALKADAAAPFRRAEEILLTADSVVILDDVIYGKPADAEDAARILRQLSGRCHEVITGVCLQDGSKRVHYAESARVWMEALREEEIDYYIRCFQPMDKAGAYAIQEWIGLCKISRFEGTYSNVKGLPMSGVYEVVGSW